ncbi:MAG: hypothetical protein Q4B67_03305 [Eubacteriales bacterium]|nr:hypothetical protein [Eubacteriales bacterium]
MGFFDNLIKNAVAEGLDRGLRDVARSAVEKVVNPVADTIADKTSEAITKAAEPVVDKAAETGKAASDSVDDVIGMLTKMAAEEKAEKAKKQANFKPHFYLEEADRSREADFLALMEKYKGFELSVGYRDWVDHTYGGKKDKVWYVISYKSKAAYYEGVRDEAGNWTDKYYTCNKGEIVEETPAESGITIGLVCAAMYKGQEKLDGRGAQEIEVGDLKCSHYCFGFGTLAFKVADDYGVTIEYNDIENEDDGFRLRELYKGSSVMLPGKIIEP